MSKHEDKPRNGKSQCDMMLLKAGADMRLDVSLGGCRWVSCFTNAIIKEPIVLSIPSIDNSRHADCCRKLFAISCRWEVQSSCPKLVSSGETAS